MTVRRGDPARANNSSTGSSVFSMLAGHDLETEGRAVSTLDLDPGADLDVQHLEQLALALAHRVDVTDDHRGSVRRSWRGTVAVPADLPRIPRDDHRAFAVDPDRPDPGVDVVGGDAEPHGLRLPTDFVGAVVVGGTAGTAGGEAVPAGIGGTDAAVDGGAEGDGRAPTSVERFECPAGRYGDQHARADDEGEPGRRGAGRSLEIVARGSLSFRRQRAPVLSAARAGVRRTDRSPRRRPSASAPTGC